MLIPSTLSSKPVTILCLQIDPPPAPWGIHWFSLFSPSTSIDSRAWQYKRWQCYNICVCNGTWNKGIFIVLLIMSGLSRYTYTPAHMDADYHPCLYSIFIFFSTHVTGFERLVHEPLNLWNQPGTLSLRRLIIFNCCSLWHFRQISGWCAPLNNTLTCVLWVLFYLTIERKQKGEEPRYTCCLTSINRSPSAMKRSLC